MTPTYTPRQLLARIERMPETMPISDLVPWPRCYISHKDHWMGWLREYNGPGFYGRSNSDRDARFIWMHVQNLGMILWLAEAAGTAPDLVHGARLRSHGNGNAARQTALARSVLPWGPLASLIWPKGQRE